MNDLIKQTYIEYKKFLDTPELRLPDICSIELYETDNHNHPMAFVDANSVRDIPIKIYYYDFLRKCLPLFQKSLLFHEFTHIYDANITFKNLVGKSLNSLLTLFSEYHASQIEIMCNLGCKNINEPLKINMSSTQISHLNKKVPITAGLYSSLVKAADLIEKKNDAYISYSITQYYDIYHNFESRIMYYLGKISICQKYGYPTISDSIQEYCPDYAPCIYEIWGAIENKEFEKLNDLRNQLWNRFKEHFDCEAELPDEL